MNYNNFVAVQSYGGQWPQLPTLATPMCGRYI